MTNDDTPPFDEKITLRIGDEDVAYVRDRGTLWPQLCAWLGGLLLGFGLGLIF